MPVTNYFLIGNLSVPSSWVALIVAFVVAYSAVRYRYGKRHAEVLSDAFFYLVIVWKLSILITDFESVMRSPLAIVYFHGGVVGFYLGLVFIAGKALWDMKKGRLASDGLHALFMGAVTVQTVFQVMMVVLNEGDILAKVLTAGVFVLFASFIWIKGVKMSEWSNQFVLLFMAVHFFVASIQPGPILKTSLVVTLFIGLFFVFVYSWGRHVTGRSEEQM